MVRIILINEEERPYCVFRLCLPRLCLGECRAGCLCDSSFFADGHKIILCQSYAKNFGLYGERADVVSVVTESKEETERVNSQVRITTTVAVAIIIIIIINDCCYYCNS